MTNSIRVMLWKNTMVKAKMKVEIQNAKMMKTAEVKDAVEMMVDAKDIVVVHQSDNVL